MCGIVYITQWERVINSPKDLQDVFSRDVTDYVANGYSPDSIRLEGCLCQIDTERYLSDTGAIFSARDEWSDVYVTALPTTN